MAVPLAIAALPGSWILSMNLYFAIAGHLRYTLYRENDQLVMFFIGIILLVAILFPFLKTFGYFAPLFCTPNRVFIFSSQCFSSRGSIVHSSIFMVITFLCHHVLSILLHGPRVQMFWIYTTRYVAHVHKYFIVRYFSFVHYVHHVVAHSLRMIFCATLCVPTAS